MIKEIIQILKEIIVLRILERKALYEDFNIMIANQRIINDNQKVIMEKIYDEGEKTREYLKAEIIKSENGYVHYEPNEKE